MTANIQKFLEMLPDERLAALRAHTEDGKLSYSSCSCLIGSSTADHALLGVAEYCKTGDGEPEHLFIARTLPFAAEAEKEFLAIGFGDDDRIAVVLPLIEAEFARRAALRPTETREAVTV